MPPKLTAFDILQLAVLAYTTYIAYLMAAALKSAQRSFDQQRKEPTLSQALTDKLTELGAEEDQIISILSTDQQTIETLQSSLNAQKAQLGDDAPEVAAAQALIDKLRTAVTPTATPTGTTPPTTPPVTVTPTPTSTALPTGDAPPTGGTPSGTSTVTISAPSGTSTATISADSAP